MLPQLVVGGSQTGVGSGGDGNRDEPSGSDGDGSDGGDCGGTTGCVFLLRARRTSASSKRNASYCVCCFILPDVSQRGVGATVLAAAAVPRQVMAAAVAAEEVSLAVVAAAAGAMAR